MIGTRGPDAERALSVPHERYSAAVYGLALRVTGTVPDAEEVMQDTFWSVWRHSGTHEPGRVRFATWLLRIARNRAVSVLRRGQCRPIADPGSGTRRDAGENDGASPALATGEALEDPAADVPELAYLAGLRRAIATSLLALPPEQRQAVELAYFGGLTHREISAAQAAPVSTVKTRLALALKNLAGALDQERDVA